jgi:hypothetical protein
MTTNSRLIVVTLYRNENRADDENLEKYSSQNPV